MIDKRAGLRKHFTDEANQAQSVKMYSERLAQLSSIEETITNAFGYLLNFMDKNISKVELTNQLDTISTPDVENVVVELKKLANTVTNTKIDLKPVTDALNALKREITLIPAKIPKPLEQKDVIKVSNLDEVKLDTSKLEKAIKALDLKVDIKAPIVNVDKPDLKPLQTVLLDVLKAINGQKPTEEVKVSNLKDIKPTDTKKIETKLDDSNKYLKKILDKPTGSGGGGGNGTPYVDQSGKLTNPILNADGSIPVSDVKNKKYSYTLDTVTVGLVHTITLTRTDIATSILETKVSVIDTSDNSITESAWV